MGRLSDKKKADHWQDTVLPGSPLPQSDNFRWWLNALAVTNLQEKILAGAARTSKEKDHAVY